MFANGPRRLQLVECPYNKSHAVLSHRLPIHLIKCRRSHGGDGYKECRFNHNHVFRDAEIKEHEAECVDRIQVERFLKQGASKEPEIICNWVVSDGEIEENWDNDPPVPTYDPTIKCMREDLAIPIMHGTPTQLKARRAAQSARLETIRAILKAKFNETTEEKQTQMVVRYKVCRFNSTHIIKAVEVSKHEEQCSDSTNVEQYNINAPRSTKMSLHHQRAIMRLRQIRDERESKETH